MALMEGQPSPRRLRFAVLGLYAGLLTASAWMHDDAYITLRTVDNFVNGLGLTWNPVERVQAYTHPLWMFLNAAFYAVTREAYFTCLAVSMALSLAVVALLLFRLPSTARAAVTAAFLLISCKSFLEYSTSGLENPLTHLLLMLFALVVLGGGSTPRDMFLLSWIAALGFVNRPDTILFFVPVLAYAFVRHRSRSNVLAMAAGLLPMLCWEIFSVVYYGFPFPNTAYAKLGIGAPRGAVLEQGVNYFFYSLLNDPVTCLVLAAAAWLAVKNRTSRAALLFAGAVLYLGYVVWIGGDYMGGRFLSAPALVAAVVVAAIGFPVPSRRRMLAGLAVVGLMIARSATAPITPVLVRFESVGDERLRFYHATGLLGAAFSDQPWPNHFFRYKGEYVRSRGPRVVVDAYVGLLGYYAGPDVYVVDLLGLPDPLLARLPGRFRGGEAKAWLPGHVSRPLPAGYLASLESGENRIADASLASFYDALVRVTRGEIWDAERWLDIWRFHIDDYDDLVEAYIEANPADFAEPPDDLRALFTIDERAVIEALDSSSAQ